MGSEVIELGCGVVVAYGLVFESAVMRDRIEMCGSFPASLLRDGFFEACTGDESVDEVAVESIRGTSQGFKFYAPVKFTALKFGCPLLANSEPCCEFGA